MKVICMWCLIFCGNIIYYELLNFLRVSSEADASDDEDGEDDSSLDGSIDDRLNPTATTQSRASGLDMMAIYRFSLFPFLSLYTLK